MNRKRYTPGEDNILRGFYTDHTASVEEIAKGLGRTVASVRARAHRLGISRYDMFKRATAFMGDEPINLPKELG